MIELSSEKTVLGGVFGDIPMTSFKYARLNITFDDDEDSFGIADENGIFDGTVGRVQRNETDFAVFSVPLESFQGNFELPVKILKLVGQHDYYILSSPDYNRTEFTVHSDIEDSLLVVSPFVIALYMFMFFATLIFISTVSRCLFSKTFKILIPIKIGSKVVKKRIKIFHPEKPTRISDIKTSYKKISWSLTRYLFDQGTSEITFKSTCQLIIFTTFACSVGVLLTLYKNSMSADLVTYRKPILLDSLQDVWDAYNRINISFVESSSAAGVFMHSEENSIQQKIYRRSLSQWRNKKGMNLHLYPSDLMLQGPNLIKGYKLALLSSDLPTKITLGLECSRSDTDKDLYSNLYRSKDIFMFENQVQVTRIGIDIEVEKRLIDTYTKVVESGLHELQTRKGHEMTLSNIPLPEGQPKLLCLNVKSWSDENNESTDQLKIENCYQFLSHIAMSFIIIVVVYVFEFFVY